MEEVSLSSPMQENIPYASFENGPDLDRNPAAVAPAAPVASGETMHDESPVSTSPNARVHIEQPKDNHNVIYFSLLLAGIGFLLPYNSFITAVDYFLRKYPGSTIVFDMSLTYIVVGFVAVILNNALVESFSLHVRITFGYIVSFVALLLVAIFEVGLETFSERVSYNVILLAIAVVSLGCTVQQSSFYGYAGMLPRRFTQAVMTGESAAGVITSLNRIVTKLLLDNEKANTLTFFVLSAIIVLLCLVTHHLARRSDFIRYYTAACNAAGAGDDQQHLTLNDQFSQYDGFQEETCDDDDDQITGRTRITQTSNFEIEYPVQKSYARWMTRARAVKRGLKARREVAKLIWPYMFSIGIAYFVTLCLFPGIESDVLSCYLGGWMPIILMAIFNATDFCGKIIGGVPFDWCPKYLIIAECSRIILIPLMILCVAPRHNPIFSHDVWPMVISAGLGLSNGYFGSVPMILAPGKIPEEKKELAGNIMTLSYNVGLTGGSAVAYLLNFLVGKPSISCPAPDL